MTSRKQEPERLGDAIQKRNEDAPAAPQDDAKGDSALMRAAEVQVPTSGRMVETTAINPDTNALVAVPALVIFVTGDALPDGGIPIYAYRFAPQGAGAVQMILYANREDADAAASEDQEIVAAWWPERV